MATMSRKRRNPQAVHTGFCRSLQHKWVYLQRVIEVDPEKYAVLDSIIQSELVPALFDTDEIPAKFDWLFTLPVKDAGLGILSLTAEGAMNHKKHCWPAPNIWWEKSCRNIIGQ
eukprot:8413070-Ditylum_brightwellii.AAC.1